MSISMTNLSVHLIQTEKIFNNQILKSHKKMTTFTKESKIIEIVTISGKKLPLEQIQSTSETSTFRDISYKLFGASCSVNNKDFDAEYVKINSFYNNLKLCKELKTHLGIVCKPSNNLVFKIHKSDFDMIKALEEEFKKPMRDDDLAKKAEQDAMPRFLVYYSGFDWGDYSTTNYSNILRVRELTTREINSRNSDDKRPIYTHVESVLNDVTPPEKLNIELSELSDYQSGKIYLINQEQYEIIEADTLEKKKIKTEKAEKIAAEKTEKDRIKKEQEANERKNAEENELFIFDAGLIYSSVSNLMLHSLGARFSQEEGTIQIYTTGYAKDIPNANTSYSIKDTLKSQGFTFNAESKNWVIDLNEANGQKTVELLKKYDTKVYPHSIGMQRCWECGSYSKKLDSDGYCGC